MLHPGHYNGHYYDQGLKLSLSCSLLFSPCHLASRYVSILLCYWHCVCLIARRKAFVNLIVIQLYYFTSGKIFCDWWPSRPLQIITTWRKTNNKRTLSTCMWNSCIGYILLCQPTVTIQLLLKYKIYIYIIKIYFIGSH